jgi:hypothetical protein
VALVYSVRLGAISWTAPISSSVIFTAANGYTSVIKCLTVTNADASPHNIYVWATTPGSGNVYLFANPNVAAQTSAVLEMMHVMNPGDELVVTAGSGGGSVTASGYQLTLP